jgi:hypothetical protein
MALSRGAFYLTIYRESRNIVRTTSGVAGALQSLRRMVENPPVDTNPAEAGRSVPEHFLAMLYGLVALGLGAAAWSGMAAVFGVWSLPAAPGLGWMIAWACRYGGRHADRSIHALAWSLASTGVLLALALFSAYTSAQVSPDSGPRVRALLHEGLRLFTEPPWLGSGALLLALAGARRALQERPPRRTDTRAIAGPKRDPVGTRIAASDPEQGKAASRAA